MGRTQTVVAFVGALLLATTAISAQTPPVTKFVTPLKGQALVEFTAPQAKAEGNMVVTRIKVKNVSKAPLAMFQVDEYWYNAKGDTVSGSQPFRVLKPMMPGDIVDVVAAEVIEPWGGGKWHMEIVRSVNPEPEDWNGEM